ncbi:MAG: hypothetical protein Q7T25_06155 [Sideroxyarcus sp.]|nr:hypothetical protein [Sideroxyarcus sp.]
MNFLGALGGIGSGISAGVQDIQRNELAKQQQEMNALRMKQIQMGIDRDLKEQASADSYAKERKSYQPTQARYDAEFKAKTEEVARHNAEIQKQLANPMPAMLKQGQSLPSVGAGYNQEHAPDDPRFTLQPETAQRPDIHIAPNQEAPVPKLMAMPTKKSAGFHDELMDMVNLAKIDVKHGKASASSLHPLISALRSAEDEGMSKSLQVALTGDFEGAKRMFESTGAMRDSSGIRFENSTFEPGNGMPPMKSVVAIMPNGQRIDAAGALWAKKQAEDVIGSYYKKYELDTNRKKTDNEDKYHSGTLAETGRHNRAEEENKRAEAAAKAAKDTDAKDSYTSNIDQMGGTIIRLNKATGELININAKTGKEVSRLSAGSISPPPKVAPPPPQPSVFERVKEGVASLLPTEKPAAATPATKNTTQAAKQAVVPPSAGEVRNGYKFKGGDPRVKDNWESIKPQSSTPAQQKPATAQLKTVNAPSSPKITVGPALARKTDGDRHISDIPKDGKFYQNVIYRDGDDRFMVNAQGGREIIKDDGPVKSKGKQIAATGISDEIKAKASSENQKPSIKNNGTTTSEAELAQIEKQYAASEARRKKEKDARDAQGKIDMAKSEAKLKAIEAKLKAELDAISKDDN